MSGCGLAEASQPDARPGKRAVLMYTQDPGLGQMVKTRVLWSQNKFLVQ